MRSFISQHDKSALLLVDIGVWPFRDLLDKYPNRAKNIGIFEPGTVGLASGLSLSGIVPTVYGISPFIVQRALEQLKLDFAYQGIGGNFIVTGASYDFSSLGYSHYCPEDVATLKLLPGIEILTPGTPLQFKQLWDVCHNNNKPSYFRLTDYCNKHDVEVEFGKASIIKKGTGGTVVVVGECLDSIIEASENLDLSILYYTTIAPFDYETLNRYMVGDKLFVCTPFYEGSLSADILRCLYNKKFIMKECSVPLEIIRNYGSKLDKDRYYGLTSDCLKKQLVEFFCFR
ncbi:hypothetical protein [Succinivibrio dextrinosolvens]|uniref:hypothetical protein n=1 Tax=Succinivibrio dextrinosolvens TaxID=83771 RepID=UPI0018CC6BA0|nr:hypothetical protein [Succinivibrio dextrinosolvens]